jgi:hypothetical protein
VEYGSTRAFLAGEGNRTAHWSHDRYFKLGKWGPTSTSGPQGRQVTVLDLFGRPGQDPRITVSYPCSNQLIRFRAHESLSTLEGPVKNLDPLPVEMVVVDLGIDLENRADEVVKLFFTGFGSWVRQGQFDSDDIMQEVYKGILVRNQGSCPWNPSKSTFGSYVTMVSRGVISNHHRRLVRERSRESPGIRVMDEGECREVDVTEARTLSTEDAQWGSLDPVDQVDTPVERLVFYLIEHAVHEEDVVPLVKMARLLDQGFKRREIASKLSLSQDRYLDLLRSLRAHTASWAASGAL